MTRKLQILNFLGVLALAGLCVFQWQANRDTHLKIIALESDREQQGRTIARQQSALDGSAADLNDFRARLAAAQKALESATTQQSSAEARVGQLSAQRKQLQAELEKWTAAVAARDEALKKAEGQLQALAADRNAAVRKFNDLAGKYNASIEEIKKANGALQKLAQERNDAVRKFNELAVKYNALVSAATSPATRP